VSRALGGFLARFWGVLLLLFAWEAWVEVNRFNAIVMPRPENVFADIIGHPDIYWTNARTTLAVAAFGLVAGMLLGTVLAIAAWWSRVLEGLLTPLGILFSSVPIVALIPVLARLLGYNPSTVLAVVVLISFFPAFVFSTAGLRALPPGSADLLQVMGASRATVLRRLALPASLPSWMIALRMAAAHSVLAAMVAEFLMGTTGLGYLFAATKADLNMERALGTSVVATAVSVTCFLAAMIAERRVRDRWA
jgi:NitT/TauT family transport system permease protein